MGIVAVQRGEYRGELVAVIYNLGVSKEEAIRAVGIDESEQATEVWSAARKERAVDNRRVISLQSFSDFPEDRFSYKRHAVRGRESAQIMNMVDLVHVLPFRTREDVRCGDLSSSESDLHH